MKRLILIPLASLLIIALFGCNNTEGAQDTKETGKKPITNNESNERKIIIKDSVNDPLPPEAESVQSMPSKKEAQQIPNADLDAPIVITKMPFSKKQRP